MRRAPGERGGSGRIGEEAAGPREPLPAHQLAGQPQGDERRSEGKNSIHSVYSDSDGEALPVHTRPDAGAPAVLAATAEPIVHHRGTDFRGIYARVLTS